MKAFIELWSARQAWLDLPREEREAYMRGVREGLASMREGGIEVLGWGMVDPQTSHQGSHDFYAIYRMQSRDQVAAFEEAVQGAGWYDYFEQTNVAGELEDPQNVIPRLVEM